MCAQSWFIEWAIPGLGMFCEVRLFEGPWQHKHPLWEPWQGQWLLVAFCLPFRIYVCINV